MRRGLGVLIALLLALVGNCALAQDYGKAIIDAPAGWAYLHEEASSGSDVMGQFLTGTQVKLRSEDHDGWVEVKIGRLYGYMKSRYLKTGAAGERVKDAFWTGEVQATRYARMRMGPSTEYQFARNVNDGETVTIMGKTKENWYYVNYEGDKAFISANLVYTRGKFGSDSEEDDRDEAPEYVQPVITPAPVASWQDAYTDYLLGLGSEHDTYALIYVNDDDIPELVVDSGVEATGCRIVTYADGGVNVLATRRLGFTYIERGNRLCNADGSMDSYYDDVYEICNGRWACVARGEYFGYLSGWNDVIQRYVCRYYYWNGQATTIDQYLIQLSAVYDGQRAVGVEEGYSRSDMLRKIGEMR